MSDAYDQGKAAGYHARDYCVWAGIETELSFYRYREHDGSAADYENGFWEGVQQYDAECEFNTMLDEWEDSK
jgi:hypothetical protein